MSFISADLDARDTTVHINELDLPPSFHMRSKCSPLTHSFTFLLHLLCNYSMYAGYLSNDIKISKKKDTFSAYE